MELGKEKTWDQSQLSHTSGPQFEAVTMVRTSQVLGAPNPLAQTDVRCKLRISQEYSHSETETHLAFCTAKSCAGCQALVELALQKTMRQT